MALGVAAIWLLCSLLVWLFPAAMLSMSGLMIHVELTDISWVMSLESVIIGLVIWVLIAGVSGWLVAGIYNKIL